MKHIHHPKLVARLKRAEGHLKSVVAMFDAGRSCVEIAQQMHAVEAAIASAKRELIHDHIEHCLGGEAGEANPRAVVDELKSLAKFL
jgi:DNA-binding FrmR family transcriptional regulator